MSSVVKEKVHGVTAKSVVSLLSEVSLSSCSTWFPLGCVEGKTLSTGRRCQTVHLSSPGRSCLCPFLVHMHIFLECLDSHIPKVMLKQWRWLREECWEWRRTREDVTQGETQGVTAIWVNEGENASPVCPSPSSFGSSALLKCYFTTFPGFSRAFALQCSFYRLLTWSSSWSRVPSTSLRLRPLLSFCINHRTPAAFAASPSAFQALECSLSFPCSLFLAYVFFIFQEF